MRDSRSFNRARLRQSIYKNTTYNSTVLEVEVNGAKSLLQLIS